MPIKKKKTVTVGIPKCFEIVGANIINTTTISWEHFLVNRKN